MNIKHDIYLISDSTGETLDRIFLALKAQFSNFEYNNHQFSFTRTQNQILKIIEVAKKQKEPIILYTIVDDNLAKFLEEKTKELGIFHPNWLLKTSYTPPNGESYDNLSERVCRSIQRIQEMKKEGDVVIFSHGGPIKAAIGYALGALPNTTLPFWVDNLAVSRFDYSEGVCRVRFVNLLPKIIANPFSIYHEV